jgi:hypothetical protein
MSFQSIISKYFFKIRIEFNFNSLSDSKSEIMATQRLGRSEFISVKNFITKDSKTIAEKSEKIGLNSRINSGKR